MYDSDISLFRIEGGVGERIDLSASMDYIFSDIMSFSPIPTAIKIGGRRILDGGFRIDKDKDIGWIEAERDSPDYTRIHKLLSDCGDERSSPLHLWESLHEYVQICEEQPCHLNLNDFETFLAIRQVPFPSCVMTVLCREGRNVDRKKASMDFYKLTHSGLDVLDVFEKNKESYTVCSTYTFEGYADLALVLLFLILKSGETIKRCSHCGKLFSPSRVSELYCERTAPGEVRRTCKEAAKYAKQLSREHASESSRIYKSINTMKAARIDFAKDAHEEYKLRSELDSFRSEAQVWRRNIKSGVAFEADYIQWLNSFKKRKPK